MGVLKRFPPRREGEPVPGERLNSWKEIAAYLDRAPRTVQRWEANENLPVHRIRHTNSPW